MSDKVEIPDEAVSRGGRIIAEHRSQSWLVYSDEVRASLAKSWEPTARAVLEAALPLLPASGGPAVDRQVTLSADEHDMDDLIRYLEGDHHMGVYDRMRVVNDIRAQMRRWLALEDADGPHDDVCMCLRCAALTEQPKD